MTDMSALPQITATEVSAPPAWALLERNLIAQMEEGARFRFRQCTERGGAILYAEDFDDLFEQFYNWGLFYACLLYTSPSPRDGLLSRMPSSA